jgi:hypothetical protein
LDGIAARRAERLGTLHDPQQRTSRGATLHSLNIQVHPAARAKMAQPEVISRSVHEDERNSMRSFAFPNKFNFAFPSKGNLRAGFAGRILAKRFRKNLWRMRHAPVQASFEAETQNQSR